MRRMFQGVALFSLFSAAGLIGVDGLTATQIALGQWGDGEGTAGSIQGSGFAQGLPAQGPGQGGGRGQRGQRGGGQGQDAQGGGMRGQGGFGGRMSGSEGGPGMGGGPGGMMPGGGPGMGGGPGGMMPGGGPGMGGGLGGMMGGGGPGMGGGLGGMMGGPSGLLGILSGRGERGVFQPEMFVNLTETNPAWNTPDGMCCMPNGTILLAMPNFNDPTSPPVIVSISPEGKTETWLELPPNPDTGRVGPMGIACTSDGSAVYLNDNQVFHQKPELKETEPFLFGKSRVLRIAVNDGKPGEVVTVASGLNVANGVAVHGDSIYVTETVVDPATLKEGPVVSGFYRFGQNERDVVIADPKTDPHMLSTIYSFHAKIPWGADGMAFDKDGNFYIGTFADGSLFKFTFNEDGSLKDRSLWLKPMGLRSCDGMVYEPNLNALIIADYMDNAVKAVLIDSGMVVTLAKSPDSDGVNGELKAPCEVCLRNGDIVVSNMNGPVEDSVYTETRLPVTMSIVKSSQMLSQVSAMGGVSGIMGMMGGMMGGGSFAPGGMGPGGPAGGDPAAPGVGGGFRRGGTVTPGLGAAAPVGDAAGNPGFRRRTNAS